MELRFPSETFPPFPSITLAVGDGWSPIAVPASVLAVRKESESGFSSNIVVTCTRQNSPHDLQEENDAVSDEVLSRPEGRIISSESGLIDNRRAILMTSVFEDLSSGAVVQFHVFIAVDHQSCVDVIHAIGSAGASAPRADFDEVATILRSIGVAD